MVDFNYPDVDFVNCTSDSSENASSTLFLSKIDELLLKQHVTEATRVKEGQRPSMLGLIFTNEEYMIDTIEVTSPLGKSDHVILLFELKLYSDNYTHKPHRNIHKGNFD